jgi:hypothetical protein
MPAGKRMEQLQADRLARLQAPPEPEHVPESAAHWKAVALRLGQALLRSDDRWRFHVESIRTEIEAQVRAELAAMEAKKNEP